MSLPIRKVAERIYRGPQPLTDQDWNQLKILGIKNILDLETGSHILFDGNPAKEALTAKGFDMRFFSLPLGEVFPPSLKELYTSYQIISEPETIYVHCRTGVDRTGMVIAYWRLSEGRLNRKQIIQEMYDCGMHWWLKWWAWFLP